MTSGLELILAAICLNVTCVQSNNSVATVKPSLSLLRQGEFEKEYMVNPNMQYSKSIDEKYKNLMKLRNWVRGKHLKIATIEDFPLSYTERINGTIYGRGVSFDLINILSKKFNFTYNIVIPAKNIIGSTTDMDGSLLELLNRTGADLAASFIPLLGNTRDYLYYSTTTLDEGEWIMIMTRPSESATGSGLLAPFNFQVWILILLSLLAVGPIIYLLTILRNKLTDDDKQKMYSLGHCAWFVYGALMKQGSTLSPVADSTRLIFATWWIFITILTSFYTANLTAFLTLSKFTLPFNTAEDVLHKEKHFVSIRGSGMEYAIRNPEESLIGLNFMIHKRRALFTSNLNDTEILLDFVEKKEFVFVRDRPAIDHIVYKDYRYRKTLSHSNEKIHCPFATAKKPFLKKKRAFAYPRGSNLSILFDPELLNLVESGIVKFLTHENLPGTEICPQDLGGTERQLRVGDLAMTYYIVIAGFATGVLVFVTEVFFKYITNRANRKYPIFYTLRGSVKNVQNTLPFKSNITPPPPYASTFNRYNWKIKTSKRIPGRLEVKGMKNIINGREYIIYTVSNGVNRLIPVRAPSAALF